MYYKDQYEEKNNTEIDSNKLNFSNGITYGQTAVLFKLAEQLGITNLLRSKFDIDNKIISNSILILAVKFVLTNNSSIISYPHFARGNLILGDKIESDTVLDAMLGSIKDCDIDSFLSDWTSLVCKDRDLEIILIF